MMDEEEYLKKQHLRQMALIKKAEEQGRKMKIKLEQAQQQQQQLQAQQYAQIRQQTARAKPTVNKTITNGAANSGTTTDTPATPSNGSTAGSSTAMRNPSLNLKRKSVIDYLKQDRRGHDIDSLQNALNFNIRNDTDLLDRLKNNPKVTYNADKGTFAYKGSHPIFNHMDLLQFLDKETSRDGVPFTDIEDCYPQIESDIKMLKEQNLIYVVRNQDMKTDILYRCGKDLQTVGTDTIRDMWKSLQRYLPLHEDDLHRELTKAGLTQVETYMDEELEELAREKRKREAQLLAEQKLAEQQAAGYDSETGRPKKGQGSRGGKIKMPKPKRMKLTNTHVEGMDFSKSWDPSMNPNANKAKAQPKPAPLSP